MDRIGQHLPPGAARSKPSSEVTTHSPPSALAACPPEAAINSANLLLGFYRRDDCADPEVFHAGVSALFSRYSESVVADVCDPGSGLPATSKFVPTLSEIREACEREAAREARIRAHDARIASQLALEREVVDRRRRGPEDPEAVRRREFIRKWRAEMGAELAAASPTTIGLADARHAADGRTAAKIEEFWIGRLEQNAARFAAEPCQLSDAALATVGRKRAASEPRREPRWDVEDRDEA